LHLPAHTVNAVFETAPPTDATAADGNPMQGSCLNPHPGQFRWWAGQATEPCWVPIFRQFADRCTHYQMQNVCNGMWNPAINWTFCNSQHF
jgi:hypothetical protein